MKSDDKSQPDTIQKEDSENTNVNRREFLSSATAAGLAAASLGASKQALTQEAGQPLVAAIAPPSAAQEVMESDVPPGYDAKEAQEYFVSMDYVPSNTRVASPLDGVKILQADPIRSLDEADMWTRLFEDTVLTPAGR